MNVRNTILPILTALCVFNATSINAQDIKIGLVDMQKALNEFNKTTLRTNEINASAQQLKGEGEVRGNELKGLIEKIEALTKEVQDPDKNDATRQAKAEERDVIRKEYLTKQKAAVEAGQKAAAELAKQRKDMEVELVGEITTLMKAMSAERGVDLVFDKSFLPRANKAIIYVSPKVLDMTDEIIAQLNSQ